MSDPTTASEACCYEVEIKRNALGLMWGEVYCVTGDERELIGRTGGPLESLSAGRASVLVDAKRVARKHRSGDRSGGDVVRLDLD